tara:strand:- start:365 stop:502 length:138 start_codon:yes stop_codon:yes gene_type:complete
VDNTSYVRCSSLSAGEDSVEKSTKEFFSAGNNPYIIIKTVRYGKN